MSLDGYTVRAVATAEVRALIVAHEWLGRLGRTRCAYGLFSPAGELVGAACFGRHHGTRAFDVCGPEHRARAIVLERGACAPSAPRNAASFLVSRATALGHREHGFRIFLAYADEAAGEMGTIYQACGWLYLGQGPGHGRTRGVLVKPGADAADPRCWQTERLLRHNRARGLAPATVAEARAMGWWAQRVQARHVYVHFEGTRGERARLLRALRHPVLDYPRRPQLMPPGRPKRGTKTLTNVRTYGNSRAYALARLRRDHPELAHAVARGELSAHAAAVAAGFRRRAVAT